MEVDKNIENLRRETDRWEKDTLKPALKESPVRRQALHTISGLEIKDLYSPLDLQNTDYLSDIGFPGEFPYTRGISPAVYRSDLWIMGQYSGFGTPEQANRRFKELIEQGQTGFSIALDLPTQVGYDSDHPLAEGEVGRVGVALCSLRDMERLMEGIPLNKVKQIRTSGNSIGPIIAAMFICFAEKNGIPLNDLRVLIQNDVLKEYVARGTQIVPPRAGVRLTADVVAYCALHLPHWQPLMVCGAHFRESGSTAVQELAFAFADVIAYFEEIQKQADVDKFAPGIWMFFNGHNHLFEEIAKFRTARRVWAKILRDRFGSLNPEAQKLKMLCYTGGSTLTTQQPLNNIVRITLNALVGALAGVQTLATSSYDEGIDIPTSEAATVALRTQQIIAHETGIPDAVDPLGGGYYLESLTNQLEMEVFQSLDHIDAMGGAATAIEKGYFQDEIARSSYKYQRELELKERIKVGVNEFIMEENRPVGRFVRDPNVEKRQVTRLNRLRQKRDSNLVSRALADLEKAAGVGENIMPTTIEAIRSYATIGEICQIFRNVFGDHVL